MKRYLMIAALIVQAATAWADVTPFRTPSGNIDCTAGIETDFADVICQIIDRQGPPASPRPAACSDGWGHWFEMRERGPVTMTCRAPDGVNTNAPVADYGQTGRFGQITCTSSPQGFECRNADGHGFFLSRAEQRVF